MNLSWYLGAVVAASVAVSFSDWYFMGVLFHDRYLAHPEVWRFTGNKKAESLAGSSNTLGLAAGVWLVGPLPLTVTNAFFIKIHPLNTLAMSLGWLARLLIAALAAWLILR